MAFLCGLVDLPQCLLVLEPALCQLCFVSSSRPSLEIVLATTLLSYFTNEKRCQDWVSSHCEDNSCLKWTFSVSRDRLVWLLSNTLLLPWLLKCLSIGKGVYNLSMLRQLMYAPPLIRGKAKIFIALCMMAIMLSCLQPFKSMLMHSIIVIVTFF